MTPRNCGPHGVAWGGEGIVLKDRRSPYRLGLRSPHWLKVKSRVNLTVHVEAGDPKLVQGGLGLGGAADANLHAPAHRRGHTDR